MITAEVSRRFGVMAVAAGFLLLGARIGLAFDGKTCGPAAATRLMSDADVETCMVLRAQCAQGGDAACKTLGMTRDEADQRNSFRFGEKPSAIPSALPATSGVQPIALADLDPDSRRTFDAVKTSTIDLPDNFKLGSVVSASSTLAEYARSIDGPLFLRPENQGAFRLFKNADDAKRFVSIAMKGEEKDWLPPTPLRHDVAGWTIPKGKINVSCMTTQEPGPLLGLNWARCFATVDNVVAVATIVYPHDGSGAAVGRFDVEAARIAAGMAKLYDFVEAAPGLTPRP